MNNIPTVYEIAKKYLDNGFSIIPVDGKTKKPKISWLKYQTTYATKDEIKEWFENTDSSIAIVTGKISKIVVFDIDPRNGGNPEPYKKYNTVESRTGGGGNHFFFKYPDINVATIPNILKGVDLKSDGGYVIVPPSLHPSGSRYEWQKDIFNSIEELPFELAQLINTHKVNKPDFNPNIFEGVSEGERNSSFTKLIGKLLHYLPEREWESVGWELGKAWNLKCDPPISEKELWRTFLSISKSEKGSRGGNKKVEKIEIPSTSIFMKEEFGNTDWLIEDLVPSGGSAIVVAKRESYKTWLVLYLSHCVTKGEALWDIFATQKSNVLYITNDDPARNFQKRLSYFSFEDSFFVYHQNLPVFSIDQSNGSFESVKEKIKDNEIGLVVVDILRNTHNKDSNTDKESKLVFDEYKKLREGNPNLVLIFVMHPSKEQALERKFGGRQSEEAIGSYYWEASVDTVLSLSKQSEDELDRVVITVTKNKQSDKKIKPFIGVQRKGEGLVEFVYEENIPNTSKLVTAKEYILSMLADKPYFREEIIKLLIEYEICSRRTIESVLNELNKEGLVIHSTSKPHLYSLTNSIEQGDSANRNSIYGSRDAETIQSNLLETEVINK